METVKTQMINRMLQCVNGASVSRSAYQVRRCFGTSLKGADMKDVLAYMDIVKTPISVKTFEVMDAGFLVAGLIFTNHRPGTKLEGATTRFETVLRDAYRDASDSMKREILGLIDMDINSDGRFHKKFARICAFIRSKRSMGAVNYFSLLNDLSEWNREDRRARYKWAAAILSNENDN